jgi:hypothetical protein
MDILVTNTGVISLSDSYEGQTYTFDPGVATPIPEGAARHIFGYGDDNKIRIFDRHGWAQSARDYEQAYKRLAEFRFSGGRIVYDDDVSQVEDDASETEDATVQATSNGAVAPVVSVGNALLQAAQADK